MGHSVSHDLYKLEEINSMCCCSMCFGSAGIGRTGTIVVIDMLIDSIDAKGEFTLCWGFWTWLLLCKNSYLWGFKSQQAGIRKVGGSFTSWCKILAIVPINKALKPSRFVPVIPSWYHSNATSNDRFNPQGMDKLIK